MRNFYKVPLLLLIALAAAQDEEEAPKLLGRYKKQVGNEVFASFGLAPVAADPSKVIDYSPAAVQAASSAARRQGTKPAVSGRKAGSEPSAPGCPEKVDLRPYMSAVENQRNSNSCAANAVAGAYEYLATRASIRDEEEDVGEISRLFIYYVGRKRDLVNWNKGYSRISDEGMTLQGAIEAVQMKGAALQSAWPFDLEHVNRRPPEEAFVQAMRYKVGDAMKIPVDLDRMRECLNHGYPIVFGLKLTQGFFTPPYDGFIPTPDPNDPQSAAHGLHAMLLVGYNDRQRVFIVRNSWGTEWGVDGYAFLNYDYVANPEFNFVGMYAIQSLEDDDLTPDEDDGHDLEQRVDPLNTTPLYDILDVVEDAIFASDEEDDWDVDDMFDDRADARKAFLEFAGDTNDLASHNLQLSKTELKNALKLMGIPMVTQEELEWAMSKYDDDKSGYITFDEFLDMQGLFDGSILSRRRYYFRLYKNIHQWFKKMFGSTASTGTTEQDL